MQSHILPRSPERTRIRARRAKHGFGSKEIRCRPQRIVANNIPAPAPAAAPASPACARFLKMKYRFAARRDADWRAASGSELFRENETARFIFSAANFSLTRHAIFC